MAIVVGDIHGNLEKVRAFLDYKPEVEHIALGDYVDSFHEAQEQQIEALQLLLDSKAVLLWGNHDLHYLKTAPWFCTGRQWNQEWVDKFVRIINRNKSRFLAAYAVDGWLCTHAGVSSTLQQGLDDVRAIADMLNAYFVVWYKKPVCFQFPSGRLTVKADSIFNIGFGRGGEGGVGGIFWFDFLRESGLADIKQIFGHTETKEPVVSENYVALDTTNNKEFCWLYDTSENELVRLHLDPKSGCKMRQKIVDGKPYRIIGDKIPLDEQHISDSKGRTWDTQEVRLDSIEFALEHPKCAGFTPTREDVELFHLHRPERELEIRLKNTPRMRDLPVEEQAPFLEWMMGQTRPCIEGISREDQDFFYVHDYRRWKAGLQDFDHDLSKVYRKELLDLRREVKSLLGRPNKENTWFAEFNFHPDDLYNMNENELYDKIEVFKGLVKRLEDPNG